MAKSLRASAKVKARNARRYTPGNDYTVTHAARLNAVSQRLAVRMKAQSPKRSGKADEGSATSSGDNDDENGVDNDIDADATDNKGWYLCLTQQQQQQQQQIDEQQRKAGSATNSASGLARASRSASGAGAASVCGDLELLGLVDPQSISLADGQDAPQTKNPWVPEHLFGWMFDGEDN